MPVQIISINNILIEKSRFSLNGFLFKSNPDESCPGGSFNHLGILQPVVVYRDGSGRLHLIDGIKRIHYARQNRMKKIDAIVLNETAPVTAIITLILCDKNGKIKSSIINKIQFIRFAQFLDAPEPWILESLCIPFGFKPYRDFLRDCDHMNNLPAELKLFCHEKRFSLKQIINLTRYPGDILRQLIKWRSELTLTASILEEIASNLKDYLKAHNKTLYDFLSESGVQEILESSLSLRDKTERLRRLIYVKRFPILTETNAKIRETVEKLNLPKAVSVNWDMTLENKNVDLSVNIKDPEQWRLFLKTLGSEEVKKAVESILDEL